MIPLRKDGSKALVAVRRMFEVFAARTDVRDLDQGCALRFPGGAGWDEELPRFRELFLESHPDFTVEIEPADSAGDLWLAIEGPEGTRDYLAATMEFTTTLAESRKTHNRWRLRRLTAPLRRLPDVLLLGAARGGTTSLFWQLAGHPGVAQPWRKEVGFFDRLWDNGLLWYRANFPIGGRSLRVVDATPEYLLHPHAPGRVARTLPRAKHVVLLRDPVVRAHSHYQLELRNGYETLPFDAAIEREEQRLAGELEKMLADESYFSEARHHFSYATRGHYAEQLEPWFDAVGRENVLVLCTEHLQSAPEATLARALEFLDLEPWRPEDYRVMNRAPRKPIDPGVQARLEEHFAPHNRRLFELLGEDFGWPR